MEFVSKLPPSATSMERALEQVFWEEIQLIERDIKDFLNPWKCRVDLLPYLAWELSVDDWDDSWDESIKRGVCANALIVHIYKGTRYGVEHALDALGVNAEIEEWFETTPELKPGRFKVTAWANKNLSPNQTEFLNENLYSRIESAINNAKNTRSHFDFTVGAKFGPNTLQMAGAITNPTAMARCDTDAIQQPLESKAAVEVATRATGISITRQTTQAIMDAQPNITPVAVAGSFSGYAVLKLTMEAA
ncbi:phage tail protein I [Vibrio sp. ER1A]|uniref:phage tail protein I n=1 Tax=Vibrio sp. ER1A TaxID=1517681 RepID=UPI00068EC0D9|nr:phage tail protein I [Vibrio sp. ER1A]